MALNKEIGVTGSTEETGAERQFAVGTNRILSPVWDGRETFTVVEAGKILGLARGTAYAAAKAGKLPAIWIGRRCIIPRHALEKLLAVEVRP
jgi:excisionase family DNA binding protein